MCIILFFLFCCVFLSCQQIIEKIDNFEIFLEIEVVENGLRSFVFFEGNFFWMIEEWMNYYGVLGVSIVVIKDFKVYWSKIYGIVD